MLVRMATLVLLSQLISNSTSQAQTATKTPLVFECLCDDTPGRLFSKEFRDQVTVSPRYKLATSASDEPAYKVDIDSATTRNGDLAFSVVILIGLSTKGEFWVPTYVAHYVQVCVARDEKEMKECAANTLATIDTDITANEKKPHKT